MTPAELFLEYIKPDGRPERQLKQYEALALVSNPVSRYLYGNRKKGSTFKDLWGTTIVFAEDAPGPTPHITEENKVIKDITRWREYAKAPDLISNCQDGWETYREQADAIRARGQLPTFLMGTGMFEQTHFLLGFEDTLTNFYEHPQEMHELIDYIFEYRMTYIKMVIENLHPDVILSHDDWGTRNSLFMQPDIWREFYKEPYRKFYGYIREQGVIAMHHADSYLVPIIEDMIEIGIQAWQGVLPENNVPTLLDQINGRMTLMGGIGAVIDRGDATEDEVRRYVHDVLKVNCPKGHFIPCITYGAPGTVFPVIDSYINAEIEAYNQGVHLPDYTMSAPVRRNKNVVLDNQIEKKSVEAADVPVMTALCDALCQGKKKRVLSLCDTALNQGYNPQAIINEGLVPGMVKLGKAFSANRVFVPEMLLAARCMAAASEKLKPLMVSENQTSIGKVCIGTVKGDLHDIGKNLVKIMFEGNGMEVIDLGSDVPAETFVATAKSEHCDIICCSALLTTTMPEMKRVVELCVDEGIRDQVKIMIGGAPVSQEFCDDIHADIYTLDAAEAARCAVVALSKKVYSIL